MTEVTQTLVRVVNHGNKITEWKHERSSESGKRR